MRKSFQISVVLLGFTIAQLAPADAAVKPNSSCTKPASTAQYKSTKLVCIKSGNKFQWKPTLKNSAAFKPETPISDSAAFGNLEKCRIKDGDYQLTNMTAGFPIPSGRIDLTKGSKVQIIGVDFPDKPGGNTSPKESTKDKIAAIESFWRSQATVPVKFEWKYSDKWLRLPNSIKTYGLGGSFFEGKFNGPTYFNFARNIISMADVTTDFTDVNFIFIVFPSGITNEEIGTFLVHTQGIYSNNEGSVSNLIVAGGNYASSDTYIHEFGHALGLTDIRDTTNVGAQTSDGMYYDVMNNPRFPEILVWHRFLLGFLEDKQIHCIATNESSTHWIVPVEKISNELKGVIIPLNETEAVIVESRRALGFDKNLAQSQELIGAVVYHLDSKIPYHRSPVKVVGVLKKQASVSTSGYKISLLESGNFGDVIKVEKSN